MPIPSLHSPAVKRPLPVLIMILLYAGSVMYFLQEYFITDTNIYLGLIFAPYILIIKKGDYSFKYLFPLTLFIITSIFIPVKSVLFLTLLFGIMFLIESCIGKLNNSLLILLILISPIFYYFNNSIGFPIRIWLSEVSGKILSFAGQDIQVVGNIMIMGGDEFNVDSACAGLKMIMISFIIALFILSYYQRKTQYHFSLFKVLSFLFVTLILNILCNLIRIITLVYFKILPENILHDILGILCLTLYVIVPLLVISNYKFEGHTVKTTDATVNNSNFKTKLFINAIIMTLICFSGVRINSISKEIPHNNYYIEGFNKTVLKTGVIKFENANSLIYLKPMKFYNAEHNPMICWRGSGYEFKQINKEIVNGHEIFTGVLTKEQDKIYTAWWYDNGKHNTISQLDWRWKVLRNEEDFFLLNVNASTHNELISKALKLLNKTNFKNQISDASTH